MGLFSTVLCAQEGPERESFDHVTGTITASVTVRCFFVDRIALVLDVLENQRQWPLISSIYSPVAQSCTIVPGGGRMYPILQAGPTIHSLVTINYGVPRTGSTANYDIVEESIEPMSEFTRLDHRDFAWGARDGTVLTPEEAPGKLDVKVRLARTIYKLGAIPGLAFTALGKCHNVAYTSTGLGYTFPTETLMYGEPRFGRTISTAGPGAWNYSQQWYYKPEGWNKYYRAETDSYEYIFRKDLDPPVRHNNYPPANLSALM